MDNKKVYKKWKKQVAKNREYNCGGKYNSSDELLILSTCEYSKENGRLAILCKQVTRRISNNYGLTTEVKISANCINNSEQS